VLVSGIRSVLQTTPKSLQYGAKGMSYGIMAHHTLTSNGLVFKHVLKPIGEWGSKFFGETLHFKAIGQGIADGAGHVWGFLGKGAEAVGLSSTGWLGKAADSLGLVGQGWLPSAAGWVGNTFSTIMGKTALESSLLMPFIGASTITIGNLAAIGAAVPLVGLAVKYFRGVAAKRAAAVAAEAAAKAAAEANKRLTGRTIAIAGGGVAAGALGISAMSGSPAAAEAGKNLSKVV
jgi:hypothetical protein